MALGGAVEVRGAEAGERRSDIDPGAAAFERGRDDARAFQEFPGDFEQLALLRIERQRLARAHAEEVGVEQGGVVEEAAFPGDAGAGVTGVRVEEPLRVPAAVGGEGSDGVAARADQLPQVLR